MNIGDKFHADINGGIEVTIIDKYYCGETFESETMLLLCVGNGALYKFSETTVYTAGDVITYPPKYEGFVEWIENLKDYE